MSYISEMCQEVVKIIQEAGFTVYVSKDGEYGFFTAEDEPIVVSFSGFRHAARFYGCYTAPPNSGCGTGWGIDDIYPLTVEKVHEIFRLAHYPPRWAVGNHRVTLVSTAQYLKTYTASGFQKVEA